MDDLYQVVKTDPEQVNQFFFWWKSLHWRYKCVGLVQNLSQNISQWKKRLFRKLGFFKNPTALTLLSKVPPCTIILVQDRFLNLTIWKPTAQAFQNTFTFGWYLFNSSSNFHVTRRETPPTMTSGIQPLKPPTQS